MDDLLLRCPACPADPSAPCLAESEPHWCETLRLAPGVAHHIRALSASRAGTPPSTPQPRRNWALTRMAIHCPYRECGTGCRATRCHAGLGDRDGGTRCTLAHCEACQSALVRTTPAAGA